MDVTKEEGVFLVQHPNLSFVDGKIIIYKEVPEDVSVLLGPTKNYDHYIIKRERGNNLKVPLGVYKFMMEFVK